MVQLFPLLPSCPPSREKSGLCCFVSVAFFLWGGAEGNGETRRRRRRRRRRRG